MKKLIEGDLGDARCLNGNQLLEGGDSDVTYSTHYIYLKIVVSHSPSPRSPPLTLLCLRGVES